MIKYPLNWKEIGQEITIKKIADSIQSCINNLHINNLSLSGGIDSTLLLYFIKNTQARNINCYTISSDDKHPDYIYSKLATDFFNVKFHPYFITKQEDPNNIVRIFYKRLDKDGVKQIIAGDGIDEFSCGYYSHQENPSERNYYRWLARLNGEQLTPLNSNSKNIEVFLPYLSPEVVSLLSQIPTYDKVDKKLRKKLIVEMATNNIPQPIIDRWKFGFCDASSRKDIK